MKVQNNNGQKVLCAFIQALQGRVAAKDYKTITGELSEHAPKYVFVPMIVAGGVIDASTPTSAINIG